MLATSPDNVPQNGVRTPMGSSVSWSRRHVQPASTVTYMSCVLTLEHLVHGTEVDAQRRLVGTHVATARHAAAAGHQGDAVFGGETHGGDEGFGVSRSDHGEQRPGVPADVFAVQSEGFRIGQHVAGREPLPQDVEVALARG